MKIQLLTANLNDFDEVYEPVEQVLPPAVELSFFRFTDKNFPPRRNALHPRLQQQICKMFSWQLLPGADYYLWVDASCSIFSAHTVRWFLEKCVDRDMAFFKHPDRRSIREEITFLREKLSQGNRYLKRRYEGEFLDGLEKEIFSDARFIDNRLYASTAFMYRDAEKTRAALKEWWYFSSRYHALDQLALPYVLWKYNCDVCRIEEKYLNIPYITYTRNKKWKEKFSRT